MMMDNQLKAAISYANAGFTVIELNGKVPIRKGWQHTTYRLPDEVEQIFSDWKEISVF